VKQFGLEEVKEFSSSIRVLGWRL